MQTYNFTKIYSTKENKLILKPRSISTKMKLTNIEINFIRNKKYFNAYRMFIHLQAKVHQCSTDEPKFQSQS